MQTYVLFRKLYIVERPLNIPDLSKKVSMTAQIPELISCNRGFHIRVTLQLDDNLV